MQSYSTSAFIVSVNTPPEGNVGSRMPPPIRFAAVRLMAAGQTALPLALQAIGSCSCSLFGTSAKRAPPAEFGPLLLTVMV